MSLCIRTIPNKFTPFVNTRKQVEKIDRQLPKHIKSSTFLKEFLGTQTSVFTITHYKDKASDSLKVHLPCQNPAWASRDKFKRIRNSFKKIERSNDHVRLYQYRLPDIQGLNIFEPKMIQYDLVMCEIATGKNANTTMMASHCNTLTTSQVTETFTDNNRILSVGIKLYESDSTFDKQRNSHTDKASNLQPSEQRQPSPELSNKPSQEQLELVFQTLREDLPKLFVKPFNYEIYDPNIEFINNIRGTHTKGLPAYVMQVAMLRIIGHLKYAYVKYEVLKITVHPEDSTIKVRWRIRGITGTRVFLTFWKIKVWKVNEVIDSLMSWHDGFSTYYVNNSGKVYKHVADKMMPDEDTCVKKVPKAIATKLALCLGLLGIQSFVSQESSEKLQLSPRSHVVK